MTLKELNLKRIIKRNRVRLNIRGGSNFSLTAMPKSFLKSLLKYYQDYYVLGIYCETKHLGADSPYAIDVEEYYIDIAKEHE